MQIRDFKKRDREACIAVCQSNTPEYFWYFEEEDFRIHLASPAGPYLVVEEHGEVIGCGGYALDAGQAWLVYGMVHREHHLRGIGTWLLRYRLHRLAARPELERVILETSQFTADFYEREGFKVETVEKNGIAPGFDRHILSMQMDAEMRAMIDGRWTEEEE